MGVKKPKETDLVRSCLELLKVRGIFAWRQNQGGMTATYKGKSRFLRFAGVSGISDIIGIVPTRNAFSDALPLRGIFLAVECKMPGNKATADQEAFLAAVRDSGGASVVVYSVKELDRFLDGLV